MIADRHGRLARLSFLGAIAAMLSGAAGAAVLPPPGFKVAFMGDGNDGSNARAVLTMMLAEGADAIVHAGDFDYSEPANPAGWNAMISSIVGPCYPYFAVLGNHDEPKFYTSGGYQDLLEARMNCLGIPWDGDLGARSSFHHQGIFFVMTAPGVFSPDDGDTEYAPYVRDQFAADGSAWRVSVWHVLMEAMQIGDKDDESGWGVYEETRKAGAIVATGHEHSYARTHELSSFQTQSVASTSNTIVLRRDKPGTVADEGRSFAFYSGLGGKSIRDQTRCLPVLPPYGCNGEWASIYAEQQGANYGALFGEFNYDGDPCLARFYFKDLDGNVPDEFFVRSKLGPCAPCRADLDGSGTVELTDVTAVMSAWGDCSGGCLEDLDDNGTVGEGDLAMVVKSLGQCGPAAPPLRKIVLQRP